MPEDTKTNHRLDFRELFKLKTQAAAKSLRFRTTAKKGECMFTMRDVMSTLNPISRLFKLICVKMHITEDDLFDKHRLYCDKYGFMPTATNTDKHNLRKALAKPCMTVNVMAKLLDILGYSIVDIAYTIKDRNSGEISTFKYSDTENSAEMGPGTRDSYGGIIEEITKFNTTKYIPDDSQNSIEKYIKDVKMHGDTGMNAKAQRAVFD